MYFRPNESYDEWISKVAGKVDGIRRYAELYK